MAFNAIIHWASVLETQDDKLILINFIADPIVTPSTSARPLILSTTTERAVFKIRFIVGESGRLFS